MPRDLPLSNGHLQVNFDRDYELRDIYWPHTGQPNQTDGHPCRTGVWVDGAFQWLAGDGWRREMLYEPDTLVTHVSLQRDDLAIALVCNDAVDFDRDILVRRVEVTNQADHPREVRLFFHHDWHLGGSEGANTVCYRPDFQSIVAYKDHYYLLVNGQVGTSAARAGGSVPRSDAGVRFWAIGYKEFNGQQGTWVDAEDGELGGNPIAQGSVDSTVGFHLGQVAPGASAVCYCWLAAGPAFPQVRRINDLVLDRGPQSLIDRTANYWHLWVNKQPQDLGDLPQPLIDLYKRSLLVLRTQIDRDGAIIASTDDDVWQWSRDSYNYMWPRDGALVANALSHSGYGEITRAFFQFCARVITEDGYLLHKYTPAGALGSSWQPWVSDQGQPELPIQEDETALVVYSLWQHYQVFRDVEFIRPLYRPLVKAAADFMVRYREPHTGLIGPSWDLWEERYGIHAYTLGTVYAGLQAAAGFADAFGETALAQTYSTAAEEIKAATRKYLWHDGEGRFLRRIQVKPDGSIEPDMVLDSAINGLCQFGMFAADSDEVQRTLDAIQRRLSVKSAAGGIARYEADYYHKVADDTDQVPGNPWFICSCWLAESLIARATTVDDLHAAIPMLEWVRARALPSGVLAEQINPFTNEPLSVSPLTWSHAEYVAAIRWYAGKHRRFLVADVQARAHVAEADAAAAVAAQRGAQ
jgi:GH15 family glucan-1,4-alpha-glucosidase